MEHGATVVRCIRHLKRVLAIGRMASGTRFQSMLRSTPGVFERMVPFDSVSARTSDYQGSRLCILKQGRRLSTDWAFGVEVGCRVVDRAEAKSINES